MRNEKEAEGFKRTNGSMLSKEEMLNILKNPGDEIAVVERNGRNFIGCSDNFMFAYNAALSALEENEDTVSINNAIAEIEKYMDAFKPIEGKEIFLPDHYTYRGLHIALSILRKHTGKKEQKL